MCDSLNLAQGFPLATGGFPDLAQGSVRRYRDDSSGDPLGDFSRRVGTCGDFIGGKVTSTDHSQGNAS